MPDRTEVDRDGQNTGVRGDLLGEAPGQRGRSKADGIAGGRDRARGPRGTQDRDALRGRRFGRGDEALETPDPGPPARPPRRGQADREPRRAGDYQGAGPARRRLPGLGIGRGSLGGPLHRRGLRQPRPAAGTGQPPHGRRFYIAADERRRRGRLRELDGEDVRRRRAGLRDSARAVDDRRLHDSHGWTNAHPSRRRRHGYRPCRVGPGRYWTSGSARKAIQNTASSATSGSAKTPPSTPGSLSSSPISTNGPPRETSTAGATMPKVASRSSSSWTSSPATCSAATDVPTRRTAGRSKPPNTPPARVGQGTSRLPEDVLVHALHAQRERGGPAPLCRAVRAA